MKKIFLNLALTCIAIASSQAIAQNVEVKKIIKNDIVPTEIKPSVQSEELVKISNKNIPIIRISHLGTADTARGKTLEKLKSIIEEKYQGKVKIEIFDVKSAKYKESAEVDSVDLGVVEINAPISSRVSSTSLDILSLPYLFTSYADIEKFLKSPVPNHIINDINNKNKYSEILAFLPGEQKVIVGQKLVKNVNDLKNEGVLMESKDSSVSGTLMAMGVPKEQLYNFSLLDLNKAISGNLGYSAKTVAVSLEELNNPLIKDASFKVSTTNSSYVFNVLTVNKRWFYSLPEDVRETIKKSALELSMYHLNYAKENTEKTKEMLKKRNIEYYEWKAEDIKQLKQKIIPLHENYLKTVNQNYLSETYITLQNK